MKLAERLGPPLLCNEEAVEKNRTKKRRREDPGGNHSNHNDAGKWLARKVRVCMWYPGKADERHGEWSYTRQRSADHDSSTVHRTGSSAMAAHRVRQVLVLFVASSWSLFFLVGLHVLTVFFFFFFFPLSLFFFDLCAASASDVEKEENVAKG